MRANLGWFIGKYFSISSEEINDNVSKGYFFMDDVVMTIKDLNLSPSKRVTIELRKEGLENESWIW